MNFRLHITSRYVLSITSRGILWRWILYSTIDLRTKNSFELWSGAVWTRDIPCWIINIYSYLLMLFTSIWLWSYLNNSIFLIYLIFSLFICSILLVWWILSVFYIGIMQNITSATGSLNFLNFSRLNNMIKISLMSLLSFAFRYFFTINFLKLW